MNTLSRRARIALLSAALFVPVVSGAKEPPAMIYIKAKCALCHGQDGTGNTPAGKQSGVRDFRSAEVLSQNDEELAAIITDGKGKMPGFKSRLDRDEVSLMVKFVRDLGSSK